MRIELPYGRNPYLLDLGARAATILEPPPPPPPRAPALDALLDAALAAPIGRPRLETLVPVAGRVTVIVSDATRDEPRGAFLSALQRRLPDVTWTIAIATGTHGPADVAALGIPPGLLARATVVNHDGHRDTLVPLGITKRGTQVALPRCVLDADLVIATGCIRPHYFAGFGAGTKAMFPGLGAAPAIRHNHALKTEPGARAGIVDGNPCREDLEEAARMLATPTFLLDGVCAPDGAIYAAVAGDPIAAFRAGADLARPWFTVRARRAPLVIASDVWPVTASLYQAAKIAAAVAELVEPGGMLVLAAGCEDGIGPLEIVNEAIFRIGVLPRLPARARLGLFSTLSPAAVATTLLEHVESLHAALDGSPGPVTLVPRASQLLCEVYS
ncbi:MAG: lactate racemase domain-containing protein [Kofleriaceae bacterium]